MKKLIMEQVFSLQFHGRLSYTEVMLMPVWQRRWWSKRVHKEFDTMYKPKGKK